ncbi:LolA family protein [Natrialbaceae archaeon A-arb3/5]
MTRSGGRPRWLIATLAIAAILLLAGCVALPGEDTSHAEIEERLTGEEPPSAVTATVEAETVIDGESTRTSEDVWLRDDGSMRVEGDGFVVVSDGDQRWHHDLETGSVQTIDLDPTQPSVIEGLYAHQERYFSSDRYDLTELEETTVDERDAYRLTFDPPDNETVERSITVLVGDTEYVVPLETSERDVEDRSVDDVEIWLDQETLFPIKHRISGDELTHETTYRDLAIESELEDGLFEFDEPTDSAASADNSEEIALPSIEDYETADDADATVPFDVAEADEESLPENVELDDVSRYEFPDEERTQVSLFYRGEAGTISVTTGDGAREFATDGDPIRIDGTTGSIETTRQGIELQWSCDDQYYSVYVDEAFDDGTAIAVAETLDGGCS